MKHMIRILSSAIISLPFMAQAADVVGESRSTTFDNLPGIVVEISGASARQLLLNLNGDRNHLENGTVEVKGKNVVCRAIAFKTKCIIRFNNDGAAGEWQK